MEFIGKVIIVILILVLLVLLVIVLKGGKKDGSKSRNKGILQRINERVEDAKRNFNFTKPVATMQACIYRGDICVKRMDIEVDKHHPEFIIGRQNNCTMAINDDYVSRKNAKIYNNDNDELELDCYDKDATIHFIDDKGKVKKLNAPILVKDGLTIYIGKTMIKFESVDYFVKEQVEPEVKQEDNVGDVGTKGFTMPKRSNKEKANNQNDESSKADVDEFDV